MEKRRGRPPTGRKTPAEYQKAYRERKKNDDAPTPKAYFVLSGALVDQLDSVSSYFELSRTQAASDLLTAVLRWALPAMDDAAKSIRGSLKDYPNIQPSELSEFKVEYWRQLIEALSSK